MISKSITIAGRMITQEESGNLVVRDNRGAGKVIYKEQCRTELDFVNLRDKLLKIMENEKKIRREATSNDARKSGKGPEGLEKNRTLPW